MDVARGGVLRALADFRPLCCGELALPAAVQNSVQHVLLAVVQVCAAVGFFPESSDGLRALNAENRVFDCPCHAAQIPDEPVRDVEGAARLFGEDGLCLFEHVVIVLSFDEKLCAHAEKAVVSVARENHIGENAGESAVSVVKGVNRYEIKMRNRALDYEVDSRFVCARVEPLQKSVHFAFENTGWRRFVMNDFVSHAARNNAHVAVFVAPI